jgi:hypothetical protein
MNLISGWPSVRNASYAIIADLKLEHVSEWFFSGGCYCCISQFEFHNATLVRIFTKSRSRCAELLQKARGKGKQNIAIISHVRSTLFPVVGPLFLFLFLFKQCLLRPLFDRYVSLLRFSMFNNHTASNVGEASFQHNPPPDEKSFFSDYVPSDTTICKVSDATMRRKQVPHSQKQQQLLSRPQRRLSVEEEIEEYRLKQRKIDNLIRRVVLLPQELGRELYPFDIDIRFNDDEINFLKSEGILYWLLDGPIPARCFKPVIVKEGSNSELCEIIRICPAETEMEIEGLPQ